MPVRRQPWVPPERSWTAIIHQKRLPSTVQAVPGAKLEIVGFNPSADLVALAKQHGIFVRENVPDVRPYYADCDAVIAPILFGGGTRVKIVEAMAFGRPVVSTEVGAEGLDLTDGRQILLVRSMEEFPAALAKLANDPTLRKSLVEEARKFQQLNFGPSTLAAAMRSLLMLEENDLHLWTGKGAL